MSNKNGNITQALRLYVFNKAGNKCEVCGKRLTPQTGQVAHRMAKSKVNLKKYGKAIINHPFNLRATCSLRCNSAVLIDNKPIEKEQLVNVIEEDIKTRPF